MDDIILRVGNVGGIQFYSKDREGNILYLFDGNGTRREKYTYGAFGWPRVTNWDGSGARTGSNYGNRFMFTGREFFPEMGVYDYRHRWYHPALGRFLQTDPIGLQVEGEKLSREAGALYRGGQKAPEKFTDTELNLYRYCHNDPVNKTDPMGLTDIDYDPAAVSLAKTAAAALYQNASGANGIRPDHVDHTQWVLRGSDKRLSLSERASPIVPRYFQGPEIRRSKYQLESPPPLGDKTPEASAHIHNDRHGSTKDPSPQDLRTSIPIVYTSERLGEKGRGILLIPQKEGGEARKVPTDIPCPKITVR